MTKAALVSIGLVFLFATAAVSHAQPVPAEDAVKEAVRRQADVIVLRQKLAEARDAEARRDLATAARLYQQANELVQGIGGIVNIEREAEETRGGLVRVW